MSNNVIVVLVAGMAILFSVLARKRGYSHNQRIVLSGIAVGLLLWTFLREGDTGNAVLAIIAVVVLVSAALYVRRSGNR